MSDAYRTYIFGSDAWRLSTGLYAFAEKRGWRMYKSNWRILHIDGFEPGYGSRKISFNWVLGAPYHLSDGEKTVKNMSSLSDKKVDNKAAIKAAPETRLSTLYIGAQRI